MKKHFTELDKAGYPYWVDLPPFFWLDEELKEFLVEIGVL